jgi:hypothetical protein
MGCVKQLRTDLNPTAEAPNFFSASDAFWYYVGYNPSSGDEPSTNSAH